MLFVLPDGEEVEFAAFLLEDAGPDAAGEPVVRMFAGEVAGEHEAAHGCLFLRRAR